MKEITPYSSGGDSACNQPQSGETPSEQVVSPASDSGIEAESPKQSTEPKPDVTPTQSAEDKPADGPENSQNDKIAAVTQSTDYVKQSTETQPQASSPQSAVDPPVDQNDIKIVAEIPSTDKKEQSTATKLGASPPKSAEHPPVDCPEVSQDDIEIVAETQPTDNKKRAALISSDSDWDSSSSCDTTPAPRKMLTKTIENKDENHPEFEWDPDFNPDAKSEESEPEELVTKYDSKMKKRLFLDLHDYYGTKDLEKVEKYSGTPVEPKDLEEIGVFSGTVDIFAKVLAHPNKRQLDFDTWLFRSDGAPLGQVFDVWGQVKLPTYNIRFNTPEEIVALGLQDKEPIFIAPQNEQLTKYLDLEAISSMKGSDASWKNDLEIPPDMEEFSDDEKEQEAKKKKKRATKKTTDSRPRPPLPRSNMPPRPSLNNRRFNHRNQTYGQQPRYNRHPFPRNYGPPPNPYNQPPPQMQFPPQAPPQQMQYSYRSQVQPLMQMQYIPNPTTPPYQYPPQIPPPMAYPQNYQAQSIAMQYPQNPPTQMQYPQNPPTQMQQYPQNPPTQMQQYPQNPPTQMQQYPQNPPTQMQQYPQNPPTQMQYPQNPPTQMQFSQAPPPSQMPNNQMFPLPLNPPMPTDRYPRN